MMTMSLLFKTLPIIEFVAIAMETTVKSEKQQQQQQLGIGL